ncbi:MAG: 50S ribosomal protein L9 [Hyphomicrobiales bacterium]|nr:50S ribosomal protein L9 [Hyphomicrobiales bacterium]MCP5373842.1 50S ribosomal protein L9 [Hyphomicrobiales bacterium]
MEVILLERIEKLGQMGDVVSVKAGYARNYLLPRKKAMRATDTNRAQFETQRAQLEADNLQRKSEAAQMATRFDGLSVILVRQAGDAGQLYGSVKARDIADAVSAAGITVRRQQIDLADPIKSLGVFPVRVILHPEVSASVAVNVARSPEEAEIQAKTGRAVLGLDEEEHETSLEEQVDEVFEEEAGEHALAEAEEEEEAETAADEDEEDLEK